MKCEPLTPPQFVRLILQARKQGWPDEEIEKMLMESGKVKVAIINIYYPLSHHLTFLVKM